jgi:tetratricopeptide (TPR) repeat protein
MKELHKILSRRCFSIFIILCWLPVARLALAQDVEIVNAKRFIEVDQPQKALTLLNKAVQDYPSVSALRYYLGVAQIKNGQRDLALKSFEQGITLDEKQPLNYVGRGSLSTLENNPQKAKLDFDKALALTKSKNVIVLQAIAESYLSDGQMVNDALSLLATAKSIDDENPETAILLGDAYLQQNNGGLAVSSYENAALLDAKSAKPQYKIGLVFVRSRNFSGAQEAFAKAIQIDPGYTLAYKEQGELYYQMKEGNKAVEAKEFSKANEIFKELALKEDVSPITLRFYGVSLYEAGDYQQSRNIFDHYFIKAPQPDIEASDYVYYGKLLLKQNEDSLALLSLQKSLLLENKQPEVLQLQGDTYFKSKKYAEAIRSYELLMMIRPKPASQDYFALGRAYYFTKQYEKADGVFLKLIELQPNMSVGYLWEARTKSNLDPESENGLAKPYYEKVIEKASASPEKSKNELTEAYSYLGYYHFLKRELPLSKSYWQKVLALNPEDAKANEALKALH